MHVEWDPFDISFFFYECGALCPFLNRSGYRRDEFALKAYIAVVLTVTNATVLRDLTLEAILHGLYGGGLVRLGFELELRVFLCNLLFILCKHPVRSTVAALVFDQSCAPPFGQQVVDLAYFLVGFQSITEFVE